MPKAPKRVRDKFVLLAKKKEARSALTEEIAELELKCKELFERHKNEEGKLEIGHDGVDNFYRVNFDRAEFLMPKTTVDYLRVKKTKVKCEKLSA